MTKSSSAPAQALGYFYQVSYALYLVLTGREELSNLNLQITIEGLDDVVARGDEELLKLLQLKHHSGKGGDLSNRSRDLWKTIGIWSNLLADGHISLPYKTQLFLVTTTKAPEGSIASLLCPDKRNPTKAHKELVSASKKPIKSLQSYFDAFNRLSEDKQKLLVDAIQILDLSPSITDIDKLIQNIFHGARFEYRQKIYDDLMGWWFLKVVHHLCDSENNPISKKEIDGKLIELYSEHKPQLPDEYFDDEPDLSDPKWASELFVHQLRVIKTRKEHISLAIADYHKAFKQRTQWLDNHYISLKLITRFHESLIREWKGYGLDLQDELDYDCDNATQEQSEKFGQQLYKKAQYCPLKISPEFLSMYMTRGSFHELANKPEPLVYWHPQFIELFLPKLQDNS